MADRPYTYRKDVDRTSRVLRTGQLKGAKAKKALNEVQNVLDVYHNWEFPSKSVMLSKTESKKTDGSTESVTQRTKLKYEKGKQWVDSLTVNQYYNPKMYGNDYFYENEYVYTYGRLSQARMAGQDFVNSILVNWNKYRPSVDTIGSAHKADEVDSNVEIEWPHDHNGKKK